MLKRVVERGSNTETVAFMHQTRLLVITIKCHLPANEPTEQFEND